MAIKKRPPVDPAKEAEIEAFGAAAEPTAEPAPRRQAPAPAAPRRASTPRAKPAGEKAELKPMLIRFDGYEHELLREVAELRAGACTTWQRPRSSPRWKRSRKPTASDITLILPSIV